MRLIMDNKIKAGKSYAIKVSKDRDNGQIIKQLNSIDIVFLNAVKYAKATLLALLVVSSVLFPPLLLITYPLYFKKR